MRFDSLRRIHDEHRTLYGYDFRGNDAQQVEWVNLRVTGVGPITRPELPTTPARTSGSVADAQRSTREVCFDPADGYLTSAVYWRPELHEGDTFDGPAIVEEFGSTVPVHPGFSVTVDGYGNLVMTTHSTDTHSIDAAAAGKEA